MSERDELKALIDRIPAENLARVRTSLESILRSSSDNAADQKKYPQRTPVGGIITPQ